MMTEALFYLFALALIFSSVMVVTVRQPVQAVLFLIWTFFNAAGLFLTLGAEFLAFILLVVYIGAVAVLFLFVVMMLNVTGEEPKRKLKRSLPVGLGIGGALLMQLMIIAASWPQTVVPVVRDSVANLTNAEALGRILYTDYVFPFQVCGLVLLVAMIGAIVLTLRQRSSVKRQNVWKQLDTCRDDVVTLCQIKTGEGIE